MSDIIGPINAEQARKLTVRRAIAISYGTDGRYKELVYDRELTEKSRVRYRNGTDYEKFVYDHELRRSVFRYRNGTNYLDALMGGFNYDAMKKAGFDPDAELKVYAIPDDMKLFRWVLKDGTVITCGNGFPESDSVVLRTLDGHNMFVPVANVEYVTELRS